MDAPSILTGGGAAGFVIALAYVGRLVLDWLRQREDAPATRRSSAVTVAATANATLVQSLEALQTENGRMGRKIKHLEEEAAEKDRKIADLTERVNDIATELAQLKTRP